MQFMKTCVGAILCLTFLAGCPLATKQELGQVIKKQNATDKKVKGITITLEGEDGKGGMKKNLQDIQTTMLTKEGYKELCEQMESQRKPSTPSPDLSNQIAEGVERAFRLNNEAQVAKARAEAGAVEAREEVAELRDIVTKQGEAIQNVTSPEKRDPIQRIKDWLEGKEKQAALLKFVYPDLPDRFRIQAPGFSGTDEDIFANLGLEAWNQEPSPNLMHECRWRNEEWRGAKLKIWISLRQGKIYFWVAENQRTVDGQRIFNHGHIPIALSPPVNRTLNLSIKVGSDNTVNSSHRTSGKTVYSSTPAKVEARPPTDAEIEHFLLKREARGRAQNPYGYDPRCPPKRVPGQGY